MFKPGDIIIRIKPGNFGEVGDILKIYGRSRNCYIHSFLVDHLGYFTSEGCDFKKDWHSHKKDLDYNFVKIDGDLMKILFL